MLAPSMVPTSAHQRAQALPEASTSSSGVFHGFPGVFHGFPGFFHGFPGVFHGFPGGFHTKTPQRTGTLSGRSSPDQ